MLAQTVQVRQSDVLLVNVFEVFLCALFGFRIRDFVFGDNGVGLRRQQVLIFAILALVTA